MKFLRKLEKFIKGQKGQATISATMILLLIGGILIPPCLGFAVVSLKASQSGEQVLKGRYAADSGVEAAMYQISQNDTNPTVSDYSLNDRNVDVTIQEIVGGVYKIISTATSDTGGNTTIECYYGTLDYSSLLDSAITTNGTLKLFSGTNVTGNISTSDCSVVCSPGNCPGCPNWTCCVDCPNCTNCCSEEQLAWPTAEKLSEYYYNKAKDYPYSSDTIDLAGNDLTIGPLYQDGELKIRNSKTNENATLTLNGTVYVTGDLNIATTQNSFTLNLNNQTIYCNSSTEKYAITVGPHKPTIIGSGCVIAVGGIYFAPGGDVGGKDDFVLIMSLEGTAYLQPDGSFYGAVAGNAEVDMKHGMLYHTGYEDEGIDFPIGQGVKKVLSYTIK